LSRPKAITPAAQDPVAARNLTSLAPGRAAATHRVLLFARRRLELPRDGEQAFFRAEGKWFELLDQVGGELDEQLSTRPGWVQRLFRAREIEPEQVVELWEPGRPLSSHRWLVRAVDPLDGGAT